MNRKYLLILALAAVALLSSCTMGTGWVSEYDVVWSEPSGGSGRSMPLVGEDLGCNVWVENDTLMLYLSSPKAIAEGGAMLKYGRLKIATHPNVFKSDDFEQRLSLEDGAIYITTNSAEYGQSHFRLWAEAQAPIAHIDVEAETPLKLFAIYENWRFEPTELSQLHSPDLLLGASAKGVLSKDYFRAFESGMEFCHITPAVDAASKRHLFGGKIVGRDMLFIERIAGSYHSTPFVGFRYRMPRATSHNLRVVTHHSECNLLKEWRSALSTIIAESESEDLELTWMDNRLWWQEFWSLSLFQRRGDGRYNLYRYMLASGFATPAPLLIDGIDTLEN